MIRTGNTPNARAAYYLILTELWSVLYFSTLKQPASANMDDTLVSVLFPKGEYPNLSTYEDYAHTLTTQISRITGEKKPVDYDIGDDIIVVFGGSFEDYAESVLNAVMRFSKIESSPWGFITPDEASSVVPRSWPAHAVDLGIVQYAAMSGIGGISQWNQMLLANHYAKRAYNDENK